MHTPVSVIGFRGCVFQRYAPSVKRDRFHIFSVGAQFYMLTPHRLRRGRIILGKGAQRFSFSVRKRRPDCSLKLQPNLLNLVGIAGFEPTTPRSQSECATKLRHIPIHITRAPLSVVPALVRELLYVAEERNTKPQFKSYLFGALYNTADNEWNDGISTARHYSLGHYPQGIAKQCPRSPRECNTWF